MRLAADYQQQKNKKVEIDPTVPSRKVVRLGKGLLQEEKRKRGISRSEDNSRIERMSLGRKEVSREKIAELHREEQKTYNIRSPQIKKPEEKIVTAACYGNRDRRPDNYVTQHLLVSSPTNFKELERPIAAVRSQGNFFPQGQGSFQNTSKISENYPREVYVPSISKLDVQPQRNPSLDHHNLVRVNWQIPNQSQNIRNYQNRPVPLRNPSPPKEVFSRVSVRSGGNILERPVIKPQSPDPQKVVFIHQNHPYQHVQVSPNHTEKMISSRDDPYNLCSSKMTRRHGDPSPGRIREQELKETKKQLRGVPECKQMSNSLSNNSLDGSRSRSKKFTSLWDAQKTESRVSMRQSQEIKVQQSEIMVDYFNPTDSMLKKL